MSIFNIGSGNNAQNPQLPDLTYKQVPNQKMLEVYRQGKKIGQVSTHSTSLHLSQLVNVKLQDNNERSVRKKDIQKVYDDHIGKLEKVKFSEVDSENKPLRSSFLDDKAMDGSRSDRKNRDKLMRNRVESQNLEKGYNIKEFKEKWDGSVTNNALKIAWTHSERMTADVEAKWNIFRGWVNSQDNHVTIKDFTEKKAEFLALLPESNKQEYLNLFEFIQESIDTLTPKEDERLMKFMDEQVILRNAADKPSTLIAFGDQMPKFFKRDLEGIYNNAEQTQIFAIIQDNFADGEILSLNEEEYHSKMEKVKDQVTDLIDLSNREAETLKEDIRDFKELENKLDEFIVAIFPTVVKEITFSSAQGQSENKYLLSSNMTQAMSTFDELCESFLTNLKNKNESDQTPEAALRQEKLFEYYTAKVDQVQHFLSETVREKLSMLPKTREAAVKGYSAEALMEDPRFKEESLSKLVKDVSEGAFIGSCRAPLYRPEETRARLEKFIEFVDEKRKELKNTNIINE